MPQIWAVEIELHVDGEIPEDELEEQRELVMAILDELDANPLLDHAEVNGDMTDVLRVMVAVPGEPRLHEAARVGSQAIRAAIEAAGGGVRDWPEDDEVDGPVMEGVEPGQSPSEGRLASYFTFAEVTSRRELIDA
jgi:hypothetical protein